MNIHGMVINAVGVVNPNKTILLKRFISVTQDVYYNKTAVYIELEIKAQVQGLSSTQLSALSYLNITGESYSLITKEVLQAGSVGDELAGDIIIFEGHEYIVVLVNETFHDHTMAVMVKRGVA